METSKITGIITIWTSGQKPQLLNNGRRIKFNTASYVPIVVPGLSTVASTSATPTSSTSIPQEAVILTASRINKKWNYEWDRKNTERPVAGTSRIQKFKS